MKSKKFLISASIILVSIFVISSIVFATHSLTPSKQTSESTFHSLNDIYTLITNNTLKGTPNSLISTTSEPIATTSHSIGEIYTILANIKVDKATSTYSSLIPTGVPGTGTGYTLEDIWNLINNSIYAVEGNHDITKGIAPSASMHTTSEIYNYLNTTFRDNLSETKVRTGSTILGKVGTFVIADLGQYCEANDECSTGWCGDDSYGCYGSCSRECTTGGVGSPCTDANQCSTGFCDSSVGYSCTDGSIGSGCGSNTDCATGLYCGDTGWNYGSPVCTNGSAGQYCGSSASCAPGNYCNQNDYTCTATDGNLGSGCEVSSDCDAGLYCDGVNYLCTDGAVGASCNAGNQCSTGYCDTNVLHCTTGEVGQGCGQNNNCDTGFCDTSNAICTNGDVGDGCGNNNQCVSNACDTYNDICKADRSAGSGCGQDSECDSLYCNESTNLCDSIILTSRLQGYWPFNETSGTTANDLSGKNHNGALSGGVTLNQTSVNLGTVGKAFGFNGTSGKIGISGISIPGAFTVSAWVNITGTVGNQDAIFAINNGSLNFYDSTLRVWYAPQNMVIANTAVTKDVWQYWVITRDSSNNIKIYLNSVLDSTGGGSFTFVPNYIAFSGIGYYEGMLDEIAIWSRALSQDEITTLYNGGAGMSIITP